MKRTVRCHLDLPTWAKDMSAVNEVLKLIRKWAPTDFISEKGYRDDLKKYLTGRSPQLQVIPEYRDRGTTVDLYVKKAGWIFRTSCYIELKRDLSRKTDFDRLVGQVVALRGDGSKIILVLCGATKEEYVHKLKDVFSNMLSNGLTVWDDEPDLFIEIKKPQNCPQQSGLGGHHT